MSGDGMGLIGEGRMRPELPMVTRIGPLRVAESLALNNAHVKETSMLDEAGLAALLGMAFYARGVDGGETALLIALDQDAEYVNPNFEWFRERYRNSDSASFVYIDRVIVDGAARGQGIARLFYEDLFAAALLAGHTRVVCEVNLEPPNPTSDAFHAAMGFEEIGRAEIYGGAKVVRYFEKRIVNREAGEGTVMDLLLE